MKAMTAATRAVFRDAFAPGGGAAAGHHRIDPPGDMLWVSAAQALPETRSGALRHYPVATFCPEGIFSAPNPAFLPSKIGSRKAGFRLQALSASPGPFVIFNRKKNLFRLDRQPPGEHEFTREIALQKQAGLFPGQWRTRWKVQGRQTWLREPGPLQSIRKLTDSNRIRSAGVGCAQPREPASPLNCEPRARAPKPEHLKRVVSGTPEIVATGDDREARRHAAM